MERILFDHDITVLYVTVTTFPDGVMDAFDLLYAKVPHSGERKFLGISRPENGTIVYRAAAEEKYPGEAAELGCETLVLKKGVYAGTTIPDFMQHLPDIGAAFQQLLTNPGIDPEGYCVEWYFTDKDVCCMVRLTDK